MQGLNRNKSMDVMGRTKDMVVGCEYNDVLHYIDANVNQYYT